MIGKVLKHLQERNVISFAFSDKFPDALIYDNGAKRLKLTFNEELVNHFKDFIEKSNVGQLVAQGDFEWFVPLREGDFLQALSMEELRFNNSANPTQQSSLPPDPQSGQVNQQTNQSLQMNSTTSHMEEKSSLQGAEPSQSSSAVATMQQPEPQLQSATNPIQPSLTEDASTEDKANALIVNVDRYMSTSSENVSVAVDSHCNFIDDGVVIDRPEINPKYMDALHKQYRTSGSQNKAIPISVGDRNYNLYLKTIGTHNIAEFHQVIEYGDYSLPATREVQMAVNNKSTGALLVSSMHPILGLDPALKTIESVDPTASLNTIVIGDALKAHGDLPHIDSVEPQWTRIRESHFKYVFIEPTADINMVEILSLIQNGKLVILGINASSAYSALTKLETLLEGSVSLKQSILNTTVGVLHPILKKDTADRGKITLAETQFYLMTFTRVQEIMDGLLSVEMFNSRIENPAKVYNLSSDTASFSQESEWQELLRSAVALGASDIFLAAGTKVKVRVNGSITVMEGGSFITPQITKQLTFILTTQEQREELKHEGQLDSNYSLPQVGRFRLHFTMQRNSIAIVIRPIQFGIPNATDMRIPPELVEIVKRNAKGIVLTTGATGMGKSTTEAILVDNVMNSGNYSLVSLGDPIEYLYQHGKGIVIQREVPTDVKDFDTAIKSIFRSNPDIAEIGELRDEMSIKSALRVGSSGHMLFATLHTGSVVASIDAILNRCKDSNKGEILESLAQNLLVIINQRLLKDVNGNRYPAFEYLILDDASRIMIAQGRLPELEGHMKTMSESKQFHIAKTMKDELDSLYEMQIISEDEYLRASKESGNLKEAKQ